MTRRYDQLIGISWFREETYEAARARMADPEKLPTTYAEWRQKALMREALMRANRETPNRVLVDDDAFFDFCVAFGYPPNTVARSRYALEQTRRSAAGAPNEALYDHPDFRYGAKWSAGGRRRR